MTRSRQFRRFVFEIRVFIATERRFLSGYRAVTSVWLEDKSRAPIG